MEYVIPLEVAAGRLVLAAVLGFVIGLDRELKEKPYGMRPYMILSVGSAAFVIMMIELLHHPEIKADNVIIDSGRVLSAIITGIGFLGAAAIIRGEGRVVKGATTGTGIWIVGAVGVACGLGYYWHAGMLTALAVLILVVLGKLHERIQGKKPPVSR